MIHGNRQTHVDRLQEKADAAVADLSLNYALECG
jgi:hypothetical protein